jgi:hypothetical protein
MLLLVACSNPAPTASPRPAPESPSPLPSAVRLRPPAEAILEDAQVGLPRVAGRDHLSAAEAASSAANQPLALQTYTSWGWSEQSTRTWADGARSVDDLVLLTLRPFGARLAFAYYAQQSGQRERSCTAELSKLDGCHAGEAGDKVVVIGWLDDEVFVVSAAGVDVYALAERQAARLRA